MPRCSGRAIAAGTLALLLGVPAGADAPFAADNARLEELSRLTLSHPDPRFGGLSGLVITADGTKITMVSDRGPMIAASLLREGDRITGIDGVRFFLMRTEKGNPITGYRGNAEGLAWNGRGGHLVSFEGWHRIRDHPSPEARGLLGYDCPGFPALQMNSGLEALARGPDGTVYAIPERSGAWARPFPVWRIRNGTCDTKLQIPRRGSFLVTGADIGPDGRLYLLERHFALLGFATRIRAFTLSGDRLTGEETLLETGLGALGNMEGIASWRDATGAIRLLILADDNFSVFQTSLMVEYRLRPARPAPIRPPPRPVRPSDAAN
ncbi:MAG: esterase-like activity of phytase family protein [Pseudomonadota bacterium]